MTHVPFTVEGYIAMTERPGNGYGSGATATNVRRKVLPGAVEATRVTFIDAFNGERETVYVTDDGFLIEPMTGSYGTGIKWGISHHGDAVRLAGYRDYVLSATNLTEAAAYIAKVRSTLGDKIVPREVRP